MSEDELTPENVTALLALPPEERAARYAELAASRRREFAPLQPGDVGIQKARLPTVSRVTGRQGVDGEIHPVELSTEHPSGDHGTRASMRGEEG